MTKNLSLFAASILALSVAASPALALTARTFVSGTGSDSGTCGLATPCRTFAYALTQTAASGEIIVLSSAGYGPVTITQSVSIINTSNFAGVTVASGNGITINAGASDSVVLRGLTVDGGRSNANGIVFNSGGALYIDQCNVQNFSANTGGIGYGILMQPTSGTHKVIITNTTATNNTQDGVSYLTSGSAVTNIVIDHVSAYNNSQGIVIAPSSGSVSASISNSIASGNSIGFNIQNLTKASLDSSYASENSSAGVYMANITIALGRSVLMNNGIGIWQASGTISSYKDNRIAGNGTQIQGAGTTTATLY